MPSSLANIIMFFFELNQFLSRSDATTFSTHSSVSSGSTVVLVIRCFFEKFFLWNLLGPVVVEVVVVLVLVLLSLSGNSVVVVLVEGFFEVVVVDVGVIVDVVDLGVVEVVEVVEVVGVVVVVVVVVLGRLVVEVGSGSGLRQSGKK